MYTQYAYEAINAYLRGNRSSIESDELQTVAAMDELIANSTLTGDITLFRGIDSSEFYDRVTEGTLDTFQDDGFVSTSTKQTVSTDFLYTKDYPVFFIVHAKAGQNAFYAEPYSTVTNEYEVLLPRGSQFRVLSAESGMINRTAALVITVELI